jgi:hypothetical protein
MDKDATRKRSIIGFGFSLNNVNGEMMSGPHVELYDYDRFSRVANHIREISPSRFNTTSECIN